MKKSRLIFFFFLLIFVTTVTAQIVLPENIQKIKEYNIQYFSDFSLKATFFIAFLAGILGILSPCILPLLPAYFSYTFKERKNITFMTFVFFLGFSLMFVILGVIAGFLGQQTMNMIQGKTLIRIAAIFIFLFGVMSFFGKSLTLLRINYTTGNDIFGVFLFGVLFAISWTGCLGPVLSGILGIGAILGNYIQSGFLLFFYGLGTFVPLFLLSFFYDKLNLKKFLKGQGFEVKLFKKRVRLNTINVLSGILLMSSAFFLLLFGDTKYFNRIDPFSTKMLFYEYQNRLISIASSSKFLLNIAGVGIIVAVIIIILIVKGKKRSKV